MKVALHEDLWRKARYYRWIFIFCPFIREVFIINSLAKGTATIDSDIDLLIITDRQKVLEARFFISFISHFLYMRVHHKKRAGRFCLSFFVDCDNVYFKKIKYPNDPLLDELLAEKKILYQSSGDKKLLSYVYNFFALFGLKKIITWYTDRSIVRAQKGNFPNASIIISSSIFKFHENDPRQRYYLSSDLFLNSR